MFKFDGTEIVPRWIKLEIVKINSVNILSLRFTTEVRGVFYSRKKICKIKGSIF
jgi:hypothetical protein